MSWPFPPFPNPLDRPGLPPGRDRYVPSDEDEPAPFVGESPSASDRGLLT